MKLVFIYMCASITTCDFKEKILTFTVTYDFPNSVLDELRDSPETWNVELNTIDIYTCKISKKDVPFEVVAHNNTGLDIHIYLHDIKPLCSKCKIFYITAFSLQSPTDVFKTKIYQVEQHATLDIIIHKISSQLLRFILTMVYLYQGIIKIDGEPSIKSNYLSIITEFRHLDLGMIHPFASDYPILDYRLRKGLIAYIKAFLHYFDDDKFLKDGGNESEVFIADYIFEDTLLIRNIPNARINNYLTRILDFINDEVQNLFPLNARLREVLETQSYDSEDSKISCCMI